MHAVVILAVTIAFLLFLIYGYSLNFFLKRENYHIETDLAGKDKRIVLLADLHGNCLGRGNKKLISMIEKAKPDFVCIAGDMTVKNGKNTENVKSLLKVLVEKYPVYYSPGNHEIRMPEYRRYRRELKEMGVCYLQNEWEEPGDGYAIGGLDLPEFWYHKFYEKRDMKARDLKNIMEPPRQKFGTKKVFPVLLAHNPEYFRQYAEWGAGLVLSGHVHGGIARLPFLGGVISPSLRLFPTYDAGLFREGKSCMVLSRGLGLHHIKLRFFNRPELSVIDIRRENR